MKITEVTAWTACISSPRMMAVLRTTGRVLTTSGGYQGIQSYPAVFLRNSGMKPSWRVRKIDSHAMILHSIPARSSRQPISWHRNDFASYSHHNYGPSGSSTAAPTTHNVLHSRQYSPTHSSGLKSHPSAWHKCSMQPSLTSRGKEGCLCSSHEAGCSHNGAAWHPCVPSKVPFFSPHRRFSCTKYTRDNIKWCTSSSGRRVGSPHLFCSCSAHRR